jgi:hypothetical protein
MKESESEVLKFEESESELLCTDSTALLTTFMCQLSKNLVASTSSNPMGLSRPVMGFLYLFIYV